MFTYTNSAGDGAAIPAAGDRVNPDPKTPNQSSKLFSVRDPRGNETTFAYFGPTSGQDRWKLKSRTDRDGMQATFSYDNAARKTTVTTPLPSTPLGATSSRTTSYVYDTDGKVISVTNAKNEQTTITWWPDRHVKSVTEPNGAYSNYAYNANGYPTLQEVVTDKGLDGAFGTSDDTLSRTRLSYQDVAVDSNDVAAQWKTGRTIPHLSRLSGVTDARDHTSSFTYDPKGNLETATDEEGNVTTFTYNGDGTVATVKDANLHVTQFLSHDANGFAQEIRDPLGRSTEFSYNSDGLLRWVQRPAAASDAETLYNATFFHYDSFHRQGRQTTPKSGGEVLYTQTTYDNNDNVTEQSAPGIGAPGPATKAAFDAMDRVLSSTNPGGERTELSYDVAGRVKKIDSPKGVATPTIDKDFATFLDYDALDRVIRQTRYLTDAAGAVVSTVTRHTCYDNVGNRSSVTAPKAGVAVVDCAAPPGFTTRFAYDAAHRVKKVTDPEGRVETYDYDPNSNLRTHTDQSGNATSYTYDKRNLVATVEEPFQPDAVPARTVTTKYVYDPVGNLKKLISPRAWDASGDKTTFTDYVTTHHYDDANQLVKIELPKAGSFPQDYVHRSYDPNGNLEWTSFPVGVAAAADVPASEKTLMTYFEPGWIQSIDEPGLPAVRFDYNAAGQQTYRKAGQETAELWSYASDGMLLEHKDRGSQAVTFTYDANNNLASALDAAGLTGTQSPQRMEVGYDSLDRVAKVREKLDSEAAWRYSTMSYDLNSNVSARTDDAKEGSPGEPGRDTTFTYDTSDRLTTSIDKGPQSACDDDKRTTHSWTPTGWQSQRVVDRGTSTCGWSVKQTTNWTYFANGKVKTLATKNASGVVVESHDVSYVDSGIYVNGHRTKDVATIKAPDGTTTDCSSSCTTTYTYDPRDRLTREQRTPGPTRSYDLDALGNVTKEYLNGALQRSFVYDGQKLAEVRNATDAVTERYLYAGDDLDCIVKAAGTAADCKVSDGQTPSSNLIADYSYDYIDRPVRYRSFDSGTKKADAKYDYDALDRLVKEVETHGTSAARTTTFTYQGLSDLVTKEVHTQAAVTDVTKTYSYDAHGTRIGMDRVQGTTSESFTYGYDVHGNVSLLLQGSTVKASYGYKPYGETDTNLTKGDINQQNPLNAYRYSGKRFDSGSGTLDMAARRFAPDVGRFLTPDVYQGAVSDLGLSLDPLTQNRYAFAGGNPISFIETDGHRFEDDGPNESRKVSGPEGRRLARAVEEATGVDLGVPNRVSGGNLRASIQHVATSSPVGNIEAMVAMRAAVDAQIARRAYAAEHNPLSRSEALDIAGMFYDPIDAVRCGGDVVGGKGLTANCFAAIPVVGILRIARHADVAGDATRAIDDLAARVPAYAGGKTQGALRIGGGDPIDLISGTAGPAASIPKGTPGFDAYVRTHVEGHAAALLRQRGGGHATLYINKVPCTNCARNLERALPEGAVLEVFGPNGYRRTFVGTTG